MSPFKDPEYAKEYSRAYYQKNKEKRKRTTREWCANNKDRKKAYDKEYAEKNKDKRREQKLAYRKKNKEKIKQQNKEYYSRPEIIEKKKAYDKKYREENKERIAAVKAEHYQTNRERFLEKGRVFREENREKLRQRAKELYTPEQAAKRKAYRQRPDVKERQRGLFNEWRKKNYQNNIQYKLAYRLRGRMRDAVKGNYKSGSAVDDLGCTIEEFKDHIESQFKEGMTWDNWTHDGWHLDHKKQLSKFDLTDRKQFKEAAHYSNLQPLWWWENLEKREY
tara:strand:- start:2 stop:835 length:834 start_codon:yes stop_codon:yes gene_type:complete